MEVSLDFLTPASEGTLVHPSIDWSLVSGAAQALVMGLAVLVSVLALSQYDILVSPLPKKIET